VEGENRTLVLRTTTARSAIKLHPPLKTTRWFFLIFLKALNGDFSCAIRRKSQKPKSLLFNPIKQELKIFAQLRKLFSLLMGTTPSFSCHNFPNKHGFLNSTGQFLVLSNLF
jgi:hypothetical protein